jgi:cell division protease FtsH
MIPAGLVILFLLLMRNKGPDFLGKLTSSGAVKANPNNNAKITFSDVAGVEEAKQELVEIVDFLKNPKKYLDLGGRIPKGVLLVGPPGTGKTLLAKAVAGEAGVPFFSLSGSNFVEMFVGIGAARVRDLFNQAHKNAPCIVFIDEVDAVGRQRGAGLGGGHDEKEQTLNQLLVAMDGFEPRTGIIVLAATNRPDVLDPALLRAGRFDRQVVVSRPDVRGREEILKVHARGKKLDSDVNLQILAQMTSGFTGADLENLLNEGALLTARENKTQIGMKELEKAIDRIIAGPEKPNMVMSLENKKTTAYHEIGHALVTFFEKDADPLHKLTIIPRGMALGVTMMRPKEDHLNYTKNQLLAKIKVLLGGRVAEEIIFGDITTGAENDLERATALLRNMILRFGMSEKLGPLTYGQKNEQVFLGRDFGHTKDYSDETATKIDIEMLEMITNLKEEVKQLLLSKRTHMDAIAEILLERETLDALEFEEIINQVDENPLV